MNKVPNNRDSTRITNNSACRVLQYYRTKCDYVISVRRTDKQIAQTIGMAPGTNSLTVGLPKVHNI